MTTPERNNDFCPAPSTCASAPPLPRHDAIPLELRQRPQWVAWTYEESPRTGKLRKRPYSPRTGYKCDGTDPANGTDFDTAVSFAKAKGFRLGFVLAEGDGIVCIDLDDHGDPVDDFAQELALRTNSYTERSPSGKGKHVWVLAHIPANCPESDRGVEVYTKGRFITFTGDSCGDWHDLQERQAEVMELCRYLKPDYGQPKKQHAPLDPSTLSIEAERARQALALLSLKRLNSYYGWLYTGMALCELGDVGLELWIEASSKTDSYDPAECEAKWLTFDVGNGYTLASLHHWAKEDSGQSVRSGLGAPTPSLDDVPDYLLHLECDPFPSMPDLDSCPNFWQGEDTEPGGWRAAIVAHAEAVGLAVPTAETQRPDLPTYNGLTLMPISYVREQMGEVKEAWPLRMASGLVTFVAADQGVGKSIFATQCAKVFTVPGTPWPDGQPYNGPHGNVLLLETDGHRQNYYERFLAIGGDESRLLLVTTEKWDYNYTPNIDRQMDAIERLALEGGCVAVILDSLSGGRTDLDENSQKAGLIPSRCASLARALNAPVIIVHHLRKKSPDEPARVSLDRLRGSTAITQPATSVLGLYAYEFDQNEDDLNGAVCEVVKWSHRGRPTPFGFVIKDDGLEYRDAPDEGKEPPRKVIERARVFLREVLADGPMPRKEIITQGHSRGFAPATIDRAAKDVAFSAGYGQWALR